MSGTRSLTPTAFIQVTRCQCRVPVRAPLASVAGRSAGGFGLLSRRYGSGAAGVLEMEVVRADGRTVICNDHQNQDLFRPMKGGGGGTFGIMTSITFETFPPPDLLNAVSGRILRNSDRACRELIKAFFEFVPAISNDPRGGGVSCVKQAEYQPLPSMQGVVQVSVDFNYLDQGVGSDLPMNSRPKS